MGIFFDRDCKLGNIRVNIRAESGRAHYNPRMCGGRTTKNSRSAFLQSKFRMSLGYVMGTTVHPHPKMVVLEYTQ